MAVRRVRGVPRAAVAGGVLLLAAVGCGPEVEAPPEVLRPVRTTVVEQRTAADLRVFSGLAKAGRETELSFRVAGRVESLPVRVGQQVRRGALIAGLERRDFEIALQQAQAALAQAEASARNADSNLDRIRGLWENENVSQNELDQARAQAESFRAQVDVASQQVAAARRQLGYTRLYAPTDGAIAAVAVEISENVGQGTTVALLTSGDQAEVEIAMPEVLIAGVEAGDLVIVRVPAIPGETFNARVTEVGVAAVGGGAAFPVTAQIEESDARIRSGMAVDVEFRFTGTGTGAGDGAETIYLPAHAVGEDRQGRYVFVLEPSDEAGVGVVQRRAIEIGELNGRGELEVRGGLDVGTTVVTAGVRRLRDGQRVRLLEAGS